MPINRGSHPIFHGRNQELDDFQFFLNEIEKQKTRTSFLIQGSPGAGKTTLAQKCSDLAEKQGWQVVVMNIPTLLHLKEFRKAVGREPRWKFWRKRQVKIPLVYEGTFSSLQINFDYHTFVKTLNAIHCPTILYFDEAQRLGDASLTTAQKRILSDVLDELHNQRKNAKHPIIFLMNGLGRTEKILKEYGISRPADEAVIYLKALDQHSERNIIRDYLVKEAHVSINDPQLNHWIDQISQQTHGWPSHITSYANTFMKYLQKHGTSLNHEKLKNVLALGTQKRYHYYDQRCEGVEPEDKKKIASFLVKRPHQNTFTQKQLTFFLQKSLSKEKSHQIFDQLLRHGCIHRITGGAYQIAIPSMKDWLLETYSIKPTPTISQKTPQRSHSKTIKPSRSTSNSKKKSPNELDVSQGPSI